MHHPSLSVLLILCWSVCALWVYIVCWVYIDFLPFFSSATTTFCYTRVFSCIYTVKLGKSEINNTYGCPKHPPCVQSLQPLKSGHLTSTFCHMSV